MDIQQLSITIIGIGLIGGSLALRLKHSFPKMQIVGADRHVESLQLAKNIGAIDHWDTDIGRSVKGAGLVVLAVPMKAMSGVLGEIKPHLGESTIITDVGSVKGSFVDDARRVFGLLHQVVPGHPIAGAENSGVEAAFAHLFEGRRVILTPTEEVDPAAIGTVQRLWEHCGAQVEKLDPQQHDRILAATSHLPHVLAYSLVDTLLSLSERAAIFRYAAGGFRDFTRIASSDPTMWRDVCLSNCDSLLPVIDQLSDHLAALRTLISNGDGEALHALFSRAKRARDEHYE